jgi:hypothetical protein
VSVRSPSGRIDRRVETIARSLDAKLVLSFADGKVQNISGHTPTTGYWGNYTSGYPGSPGGLWKGQHTRGGLECDGEHGLYYPSNFGFLQAGVNTSLIIGVTPHSEYNTTNKGGGFVKVGSTGDGFGLGIGGTTFDNGGNTIILLREQLVWNATPYTWGPNFQILNFAYRGFNDDWYFRLNGDDTLLYYTPAVGIGAGGLLGPAAQTFVGGYRSSTDDHRFPYGTIHFLIIGKWFNQAVNMDDSALINNVIRSTFGTYSTYQPYFYRRPAGLRRVTKTTTNTYSITAAPGAFTETGNAANLTVQHKISVTKGAFVEQGLNVAAAANGATATASSFYSAGPIFSPSNVINGDRKGIGWLAGTGGWNDDTSNVFPDWLQVTFSSSQTINKIDVFTIQDNFGSPIDPTPTTTFTLYGIVDFQVQYWTGSAWADVPGGNVTGNNLVWRSFSFSPITTTQIRVLVNSSASPNDYSRLIEVEAWSSTPTNKTANLTVQHKLIAANSGTPATYVLLAHTIGTGTTSGIDTTGADLIVAAVCGTPGFNFSDSNSNTWTEFSPSYSNNGVDTNARFYYSQHPTIGAGHTFTYSDNVSMVAIVAFSGSAGLPDQHSGATGAPGSSLAVGSITPTQAGELVVAFVGNGAVGTSGYLVDSGFTITDSISSIFGVRYGGAFAYKVQTSAATVNPTFSWTGGGATLAGQIASFPAQRISYVLTGNNANLTVQHKITASLGTFALTGNDAHLTRLALSQLSDSGVGSSTIDATKLITGVFSGSGSSTSSEASATVLPVDMSTNGVSTASGIACLFATFMLSSDGVATNPYTSIIILPASSTLVGAGDLSGIGGQVSSGLSSISGISATSILASYVASTSTSLVGTSPTSYGGIALAQTTASPAGAGAWTVPGRAVSLFQLSSVGVSSTSGMDTGTFQAGTFQSIPPLVTTVLPAAAINTSHITLVDASTVNFNAQSYFATMLISSVSAGFSSVGSSYTQTSYASAGSTTASVLGSQVALTTSSFLGSSSLVGSSSTFGSSSLILLSQGVITPLGQLFAQSLMSSTSIASTFLDIGGALESTLLITGSGLLDTGSVTIGPSQITLTGTSVVHISSIPLLFLRKRIMTVAKITRASKVAPQQRIMYQFRGNK